MKSLLVIIVKLSLALSVVSELFAAEDENLKNFEIKFRYRMVTKGNTGVEVRTRIDKHVNARLKVITQSLDTLVSVPVC